MHHISSVFVDMTGAATDLRAAAADLARFELMCYKYNGAQLLLNFFQ
jgi:hypothetical protein